jgi:hypothetical protein
MRAASTDSAIPTAPLADSQVDRVGAVGQLRRWRWRRGVWTVAIVVVGHVGLIDRLAVGSRALPGPVRPVTISARWLTAPARGATPDATAVSAPAAAATGTDQSMPGSGAALASNGAGLQPPTDPVPDTLAGSSNAAPVPGTAGRDGEANAAVPGDPQALAPAPAGATPASVPVTALRQAAGAWPAGGRLPVYPTRLPPPFAMRFALQRAALTGTAQLDWRSDDSTYTLHLEGEINGKALVEQTSRGGFDLAGVAPLRLTDQRGGRDLRAANFRRGVGRISFSGPAVEYELLPGAQDRLSWLIQLAGIAAAYDASRSARPLGDLTPIALLVVDARGGASIWLFDFVGVEPVTTAAGPVAALHLVREPVAAYDLRVEVWLDPGRHHLPLRLRQAVVPGGEALTWTRVSDDFGAR